MFSVLAQRKKIRQRLPNPKPITVTTKVRSPSNIYLCYQKTTRTYCRTSTEGAVAFYRRIFDDRAPLSGFQPHTNSTMNSRNVECRSRSSRIDPLRSRYCGRSARQTSPYVLRVCPVKTTTATTTTICSITSKILLAGTISNLRFLMPLVASVGRVDPAEASYRLGPSSHLLQYQHSQKERTPFSCRMFPTPPAFGSPAVQ